MLQHTCFIYQRKLVLKGCVLGERRDEANAGLVGSGGLSLALLSPGPFQAPGEGSDLVSWTKLDPGGVLEQILAPSLGGEGAQCPGWGHAPLMGSGETLPGQHPAQSKAPGIVM